MVDLADMYEGWAQDGRFEPLEIARLPGWADGLRELAAAIGTDYEPPSKVPGEPDSLMKFMANKMKQGA